MKASFLSTITALAYATTIFAANSKFLRRGRLIPPVESTGNVDMFSASAAAQANLTGSAFFNQLLDHDDPSKGTFQQKFWWSSEFWEGPGSPVGHPMCILSDQAD